MDTYAQPASTLAAAQRGPVPDIVPATYGDSHSGPYTQHDLPWPSVAADLVDHDESETKAGDCFIPATFNPVDGSISRRQEHFRAMHALSLDFDKGTDPALIRARLASQGIECVIVSTFSHMTAETSVAASAWTKWGATNPAGTAEDFLLSRGKHLPAIVAGAEFVGVEDREGQSRAIFRHNPCPKTRVVIPFSHPWRPPAGSTPQQAAAAWAALYVNIVKAIGFPGECDLAVDGTQSLVYFARHRPGAPHRSEILHGDAINPYTFTGPVAASSSSSTGQSHTTPTGGLQGIVEGMNKPHVVAIDPHTGAPLDLTALAAKGWKHQFLLIKAMERHCPDMLLVTRPYKVSTDGRSDRWAVECPNAGTHTPGSGAVSSTLAWDAGPNNPFGFDCKHTCDGSGDKDDLVYVKMLVEDDKLPVAALTAPEFLLDPPMPERPSKLLHGAALRRYLMESPPEIVPGLIGVGTITVMPGASMAGKSFLVSTVSHAVLTNRPVAGRNTRQGMVMILAGEGTRRTIQDFMANCIHHGDDFEEVVGRGWVVHDGGIPLNTPAGLEYAKAKLDEFKALFGQFPDVLFVDTTRKSMRGSVSEDKDVEPMFTNLAAIKEHARGIAIVLVCHTTKDGNSPEAKGASDWEQGADYVARVSGKVDSGKGETKLTFAKNKDGAEGKAVVFGYKTEMVPGVGPSLVACLRDETPFKDPAGGVVPEKTDHSQEAFVLGAKAILDGYNDGKPLPASELAKRVMAAHCPDLSPETEPTKYRKETARVRQWIARDFMRPDLLPYVVDRTAGENASTFRNPQFNAHRAAPPKKCRRAPVLTSPLPRPTHAGTETVQ